MLICVLLVGKFIKSLLIVHTSRKMRYFIRIASTSLHPKLNETFLFRVQNSSQKEYCLLRPQCSKTVPTSQSRWDHFTRKITLRTLSRQPKGWRARWKRALTNRNFIQGQPLRFFVWRKGHQVFPKPRQIQQHSITGQYATHQGPSALVLASEAGWFHNFHGVGTWLGRDAGTSWSWWKSIEVPNTFR